MSDPTQIHVVVWITPEGDHRVRVFEAYMDAKVEYEFHKKSGSASLHSVEVEPPRAQVKQWEDSVYASLGVSRDMVEGPTGYATAGAIESFASTPRKEPSKLAELWKRSYDISQGVKGTLEVSKLVFDRHPEYEDEDTDE